MQLHENDAHYIDLTIRQINPEMSLEKVDGLFVGLICSPGSSPVLSHLEEVIGKNESASKSIFDSDKTFDHFLQKLKAHWADIYESLSTGQGYLIYLDKSSACPGNDWAQGFMKAVELDREQWSLFLDDELNNGIMIVISALAYEFEPNPELQLFEAGIDGEMRKELITLIETKLTFLFQYFNGNIFSPYSPEKIRH